MCKVLTDVNTEFFDIEILNAVLNWMLILLTCNVLDVYEHWM